MGDLTAGGNWQRAGRKSAKRPELIKRPGVKESADTTKFGTTAMSVNDANQGLSGDGQVITPIGTGSTV